MNATAPVRAGEEELFKARAKEQGRVKLIDLITARLDARNDCFVAELPSLRLKDVRIEDAMVHSHERMPTSSASATCWVPCRRQRPSGRACAAPSKTSTPAPSNWWGTAIPGLTSSRSSSAPSTPVNRVPPRAVGALLALCSALLEKSLAGGLMVIGGLNLGGSIEPLYNAVAIVEAAADKGAKTLLMPVTSRKQLVELDDDLATRVTLVYYGDPRDALFKALLE
jgi:predicted ATP-dependent Lon-type protease